MFATTFEYYGFVFRLRYKLFISKCEKLHKENYIILYEKLLYIYTFFSQLYKEMEIFKVRMFIDIF